MPHLTPALVLCASLAFVACTPGGGGGTDGAGTDAEETHGTGDSGDSGDSGDVEIPLLECAELGPPQEQVGPFECDVQAEAWCEGCPLPMQWVVTCDRSVWPLVGLSPQGHPWVLIDPFTFGLAPTLVELAETPVATLQPGVNASRWFLVDESNTPQTLHVGDPHYEQLVHRSGGSLTPVACLAENNTWTLHGLVEREGTLTALAAWLGDAAQGLMLAHRDVAGVWTVEDLGIDEFEGDLAIADDGTVLVAHRTDTPEGKIASVLVGDVVVDLGFSVEQESLLGSVDLVPGAETYRAAVRLGGGIWVARPGQSPQVVPGSEPVLGTTCTPEGLATCDGPCQVSGRALTGRTATLRDGDDLVFVSVESTQDTDGHFEGEFCGDEGPGCSCDYVVDEDRGFSELVIRRATLSSLNTSESLRMPLPIEWAAGADVVGAQRQDGSIAAFAIESGGIVYTATLDLDLLP